MKRIPLKTDLSTTLKHYAKSQGLDVDSVDAGSTYGWFRRAEPRLDARFVLPAVVNSHIEIPDTLIVYCRNLADSRGAVVGG